MTEFIGLLVLVAQVWGAVIVLGGHKDCPKGLKIAIGIGQCLMILAIFGMANN